MSATYRCLSAAEALRLIAGEPAAAIFDVRDAAAYQGGHLEGAAHLSQDRLPAWMRRLAKETPIVIYCYKGNGSKVFAQMFADFRYGRVFSVDGGYEALQAAQAGDAA